MKTNKFNLSFKIFTLTFLLLFSTPILAQFTITLHYKKTKCGGIKNTDTSTYFPLSNTKWILQYPNKTIDTITTDANGKLQIPYIKGTFYLYYPWKFYKKYPADFPKNFYDLNCLQTSYSSPDFTIKVSSKKKYRLLPLYIYDYCPDKHPCLRKDTIIPRIPGKTPH